jgi:hypothetical protein
MSRYIDPHTRDLADRKKIVVRLKQAYTAMNQLTVKHWDLLDDKEQTSIGEAEDLNRELLVRYHEPGKPSVRGATPVPPGAGWSSGCQRFCRRAEAFACFLGDVTFAFGTITLCTGITVGCPGSIPSC